MASPYSRSCCRGRTRPCSYTNSIALNPGAKSWARRRYKIDITGIFTEEKLNLINDKEIYVPVDRTVTPVSLDSIKIDMESVWR